MQAAPQYIALSTPLQLSRRILLNLELHPDKRDELAKYEALVEALNNKNIAEILRLSQELDLNALQDQITKNNPIFACIIRRFAEPIELIDALIQKGMHFEKHSQYDPLIVALENEDQIDPDVLNKLIQLYRNKPIYTESDWALLHEKLALEGKLKLIQILAHNAIALPQHILHCAALSQSRTLMDDLLKSGLIEPEIHFQCLNTNPISIPEFPGLVVPSGLKPVEALEYLLKSGRLSHDQRQGYSQRLDHLKSLEATGDAAFKREILPITEGPLIIEAAKRELGLALLRLNVLTEMRTSIKNDAQLRGRLTRLMLYVHKLKGANDLEHEKFISFAWRTLNWPQKAPNIREFNNLFNEIVQNDRPKDDIGPKLARRLLGTYNTATLIQKGFDPILLRGLEQGRKTKPEG